MSSTLCNLWGKVHLYCLCFYTLVVYWQRTLSGWLYVYIYISWCKSSIALLINAYTTKWHHQAIWCALLRHGSMMRAASCIWSTTPLFVHVRQFPGRHQDAAIECEQKKITALCCLRTKRRRCATANVIVYLILFGSSSSCVADGLAVWLIKVCTIYMGKGLALGAKRSLRIVRSDIYWSIYIYLFRRWEKCVSLFMFTVCKNWKMYILFPYNIKFKTQFSTRCILYTYIRVNTKLFLFYLIYFKKY